MSFRPVLSVISASFILALTIGQSLGGIPRTGSDPRLRAGDEQWYAGRFLESHESYQQLLSSPDCSVIDRVGALQRLALQSWLVTGNSDSAMALLDQALDLGEAEALSYSMMSRFLLEDGEADSAIVISKYALDECRRLSDSLHAYVAYGRAVFRREKEACITGVSPDLPTLREAKERLSAVSFKVPAVASVSELSLGLSLLLNDGQSALAAWKRYLDIQSDSTPGQTKVGLLGVLSEILPTWRNDNLSQKSCQALVEALADSRMYDFAKMMAAAPGVSYGESLRSQTEVRAILDYATFVEQADALIDRIYRKRLTADTTIGEDIQSMIGLAYNYWESLDYSGERPEFSTDELGAQLGLKWGAAFCSVDFDPASFEMTWGHTIYERVKQIDQYGHRVEVRLSVLDQMVSNGMMEWLTDGDVQIGGWAPTPETVYRIRPAWQDSPIRAWDRVAYPETVKRIENRIESLRAADDSVAKADPCANLPGLSLSLQVDGTNRLYDSLASAGYTGDGLGRAFMQEYSRLLQESSIFAHEGRHVIDMTYYGDEFETWDAGRVEFSAKLSEILFSPDPWLSVGNSAAVFCSGDTTSGHGASSREIRRLLVGWMEDNAGDIRGFDLSRPTLPQIYLLSTEQLLTALRSMDPLARGTN